MNKKFLTERKIRLTDFRLSVLSVFLEHKNAIYISDIEEALGEHDRITLYRTIKTFINKGVIHEIVLPGDIKKLALCDLNCSSEAHKHEHMHFSCTSCQEVFCLDLPANYRPSADGFIISSYEVVAKGICNNCS
ncbi:MAG: transcriptional repressor [Putridiphycobacter sp.]|nr:transcriptional repressor [Putridiphycobacter sp.]